MIDPRVYHFQFISYIDYDLTVVLKFPRASPSLA